MLKRFAYAILSLAVLAGCETVRATSLATPKARVAECQQVCRDVGMKLSAFVVMMNSAGCVCEPLPTTSAPAMHGAAGASAGATLVAKELAEAAQRQSMQDAQEQQLQNQLMLQTLPPPGI